MYLFGHVGLTLFLVYIVERYRKGNYSKYLVFIGMGSMLPDIIDKPIGSLIFETGRWFGHSILVLTAIFILFLFLSKGRQFHELDLALIPKRVYVGSLFHLIEDIGISKVVVFWPLFGSIPSGQRSDFLQGFKDPFTVIFEIVGLFLIIIMGILEKWSKRSWHILSVIIIVYLLLFLAIYTLILGF